MNGVDRYCVHVIVAPPILEVHHGLGTKSVLIRAIRRGDRQLAHIRLVDIDSVDQVCLSGVPDNCDVYVDAVR